jgi:ribosomal protein S18 acetylase RimI-like enzyme
MIAKIRQATESDLDDVLALYAQPAMDDGQVMDLASAQQVFAEFARHPSYRLFVACGDQAQVLGSYALLIMPNLAHRGTPSAVVEDVVVSPQHQGQGIGRQMMSHAVQLTREAGCYKLALSSNAKRASAHAFYESLGFRKHGVSFSVNL